MVRPCPVRPAPPARCGGAPEPRGGARRRGVGAGGGADRLLGDERGLALRKDEDRGGGLDALGDRSEVGEEQERLVEHPLPRIELRPRRAARDTSAEHVVDRGQVVEPEPLHRLDVVPDDGRIGPDLGLRKDRSHSHRLPPFRFGPHTASIARFGAPVNPDPTARQDHFTLRDWFARGNPVWSNQSGA